MSGRYQFRRPRMRRLPDTGLVNVPGLVVTALALVCGCSHPTALALPSPGDDATAPRTTSGMVERVVDGDTVVVDGQHVRILGADSPETKDPRKPVMCGGPEATAFAHRLLDGQHVTLVGDPTQADRDRYHRLLRYVRLDDGRDYSIELVRAGWARDYVFHNKPVQEQDQIMAAQTEAQAARRGLWGQCQ